MKSNPSKRIVKTLTAGLIAAALLSMISISPLVGEASAQAPDAAVAANACVDQCALEYSTCLYRAKGWSNQCMIRCAMTIRPRKCLPTCRRAYKQWTKDCDVALNQCVTLCP